MRVKIEVEVKLVSTNRIHNSNNNNSNNNNSNNSIGRGKEDEETFTIETTTIKTANLAILQAILRITMSAIPNIITPNKKDELSNLIMGHKPSSKPYIPYLNHPIIHYHPLFNTVSTLDTSNHPTITK